LISPTLIVQILNEKIYGIEIRQDEEPQQDYLILSNCQRDNLEFHLNDFLSNHFAQKRINKNPNANNVSNVDSKVIVYPKLA
jgi:hypothetical protein